MNNYFLVGPPECEKLATLLLAPRFEEDMEKISCTYQTSSIKAFPILILKIALKNYGLLILWNVVQVWIEFSVCILIYKSWFLRGIFDIRIMNKHKYNIYETFVFHVRFHLLLLDYNESNDWNGKLRYCMPSCSPSTLCILSRTVPLQGSNSW